MSDNSTSNYNRDLRARRFKFVIGGLVTAFIVIFFILYIYERVM
ncbi:hypothetical protein JOD43_001222 [Pullulanibacillus pueri]|uniref:Uncharacterized protein n=1 Tax=Pullulanibacillus pueri TaxID=1437324 RepID=A0A8J2ZTM7_9BACL|nr:hypothetical protein [Pullulanibacillus pueri]MBM7681055.1 hypothetical protein [Pullulanibacillus pueri]GGH76865.1 hypothetical protein GCM10007096_07910 [Pullulanibacillus pueri]